MNRFNTIMLKIILICATLNLSGSNETYLTEKEQHSSPCHCSCKKYKKHRFSRKTSCQHERCCCCKRNRAIKGGILGGIVGVGAGTAIGASMTPAAAGTGALIGGPIGVVGGVLLSQIV